LAAFLRTGGIPFGRSGSSKSVLSKRGVIMLFLVLPFASTGTPGERAGSALQGAGLLRPPHSAWLSPQRGS
jgi:hypothetical protein